MLWIILATAIILIIGAWWFLGGGMQMNEQRKMEAYLKGKYGEEFVVEKPRLTGGGLGVKGVWVANAHPKKNSFTVFEVSASEYSNQLEDQYTARLWSQEQTRAIRNKAKELLDSQYYEVQVNIYLSGRLASSAVPNDSSYNDALLENANELYYEIDFISSKNPAANEDASKAYELIAFARSSGVKKVGLVYKISNGIDERLICSLGSDQLKSIENKDQLTNCFKREA